MGAANVTEQNFDNEVLKSEKTVLVDFWAEWCGPCKMISPIVDEIADEQANLKVVKVNVDESQQLAAKHNVMSIPTLLVIKGGQVVEQIVGAMGKDQLMEKIQPHI